MQRLRAADLRALLTFIEQATAAWDPETLTVRIVDHLPALIPVAFSGVNVIDTTSGRTSWISDPAYAATADYLPALQHHLAEHPVMSHIARTGETGALMLTDFVSVRQLHQLGLYADVFRPLGVEHQLAITIPTTAPRITGLVLLRNGTAGFTERDRTLLDLARPHLSRAFRSAEIIALLARGTAGPNVESLLVSGSNRIVAASERALRWLRAYSGPSAGDSLPAQLAIWLRRQRARSIDDPMRPYDAFRCRSAAGELRIHFQPGGAFSDVDLLVLERRVAVPPLGLSRREAEVLAAVAEGRTNADIGVALAISAATVEKHLQRIYAKLGVSNRTAAAARFLANASDE